MNFFKHHIGDYASATDHLSWDEDMAYTRLMRVYYRDERPLPPELPKVYRLARAQSKKERTAVDAVLAEFFVQAEDGWHNKRCDQEVAADREFIEQQRQRANKRWHINGNATAYTEAMPPHDSGIDSAIPPTPTPTPSKIPTPTPPKGGAGSHRRISPDRAAKDVALEVWKRLTASNGADPPRDSKLQAAIDAAGGWSRIAQREQGIDAQRVQRDFVDAYRSASP